MTCFNQSFFFLNTFLLFFFFFGCAGSSLLHVVSNCGEQGSLFVVVPELLTEVASSVSRVVGLSTCGT